MTGEITFQQMQTIVAAGGGLVLDATTLTTQIMHMLAAAAAPSGARLTFFQVGHLTAQELQMVAQAGQGQVVFDLTR